MNESPHFFDMQSNPDLHEMGLLVADNISAMLAYWDRDQVCRFANSAYLEWFGRKKDEMIGKITMKELLGPLYEKNLPFIMKALEGEKQVFEREIKLPGGEIRQSLATYIPDIINSEVRGFFVHVADITYIKALESRLLMARREMLREVINIQEQDRIDIANTLRDSINQTLVHCKAMLSEKVKQYKDDLFLENITRLIYHVVDELNSLSIHLNPSHIELLGFIPGVQNFLEDYRSHYPVQFFFECSYDTIETLDLNDKFSVFRIIQDFVLLFVHNPLSTIFKINIQFESPELVLLLQQNDKNYKILKETKEFKDMSYRVEYYGGGIEEIFENEFSGLLIRFPVV